MTQISAVNKINPLVEAGNHHLHFIRDDSGLDYIEIDNDFATAKIALQGAHVMAWQPKSQQHPVLWLSSNARYVQGRSIRGGIPVCWPWFGAHSSDKTAPSHGYARISEWRLSGANITPLNEVEILLELPSIAHDNYSMGNRVELSIRILISHTLSIQLITKNTGSEAFSFTEALHTYFNISDIEQIQITGLEDIEYIDLVDKNLLKTQNDSLKFSQETGRVFINTQSSCKIHDPKLARTIKIDKSSSKSTVVWNPWELTASKMDDLGPVDWRTMVCVESANALVNPVVLPPAGVHTLAVEYSVTSDGE